MSKRMQVLFEEEEFNRIRETARSHGLTMAEWVRQVLRAACRDEPEGRVDEKLAAIRAAAKHSYPTADIEEMLAQIERGYLADEHK